MKIKLNNPDAKIAYEERCDFFKGRAIKSLQSEGMDNPASERVSQLADIATLLELKGGGGSADPVVQLKRVIGGELNRIRSDGQCVRRALRSLDNALTKCSESSKIDITEGLKAVGVDSERLSADLVKLQDIVRDLGNERALKIKQGPVVKERTIAIHRAWLLLAPMGFGQRAGSRIIARLLDGDDANHRKIYTALHEFLAQG
jgi:hypothetical protein